MSIYSERRDLTNELKILNMLKKLSTEAFKLCSEESISLEQKKSILQLQKDKLEQQYVLQDNYCPSI